MTDSQLSEFIWSELGTLFSVVHAHWNDELAAEGKSGRILQITVEHRLSGYRWTTRIHSPNGSDHYIKDGLIAWCDIIRRRTQVLRANLKPRKRD